MLISSVLATVSIFAVAAESLSAFGLCLPKPDPALSTK